MTEKELNSIIGRNIKKYRKLYSLTYEPITQEQLAEIINVSVSLISSLESEKTNKGISINNLYKISIVLKTPVSKFFESDVKWILKNTFIMKTIIIFLI